MRFHVVLRIIRKCRCFSRYAEMLGQEVDGKTTAPALWAGYLTKTGVSTQNPGCRVNECNRDLTSTTRQVSQFQSCRPSARKSLYPRALKAEDFNLGDDT